MKKLLTLTAMGMMTLTVLGLYSCSDNNSDAPRTRQYTLSPYGASQISGTVKFMEVPGVDSVRLTIQLQGVSSDGSYPVYIREGTSIENGPVLHNLGYVDGRTPTLTTAIQTSFSNLLSLNGCLDIYRNPLDTVTIVSQAEIGTNEIFKSFNLMNPQTNAMNGQFRVYKRAAGSYLVARLDSSAADSIASHPARVYKADGSRDFELTDVSSTTHVSATALPDRSFDDLIHYTGMLKVLLSSDAQDFTLAQGKFQ